MAQQDAGNTILDDITGPFKKANDFLTNLGKSVPEQKTAHQKAIDEMNKQANDKTVQDANKTYATQTTAQKKATPAPTPGKIPVKTGPRKRM